MMKQAIVDTDGEITPPAAKIAELDLSDGNLDGRGEIAMRCSLPPHREPVPFSSYAAYETHYRDQHTNRCAECRKNFPSAHLLGLHIEETHDSFAQARRERGDRTVSLSSSPPTLHHLCTTPTQSVHQLTTPPFPPPPQYSCFVEGCDRKCSTPQKRKMHLIDKHMYPKNFFFGITRDGIDGRRSLLLEGRARRRRSSASAGAGAGASVSAAVGSRPKASEPGGQGSVPAPAEEPAKPAAEDEAAPDSGRKSPEKQPQEQQQPDHEMEDLKQLEPQQQQKPDHEMEDLSSAMSALRFVPMSVRFGRGKKSGFVKQ